MTIASAPEYKPSPSRRAMSPPAGCRRITLWQLAEETWLTQPGKHTYVSTRNNTMNKGQMIMIMITNAKRRGYKGNRTETSRTVHREFKAPPPGAHPTTTGSHTHRSCVRLKRCSTKQMRMSATIYKRVESTRLEEGERVTGLGEMVMICVGQLYIYNLRLLTVY